ncbi:MAG: hypothetical protein KDJ52_25130 [Anaerolineae bacterium]|nr:hypothetical protein [Anaerolineae bacterium]MCB0212652.1 hypothetical protein [Anaerolineae bacterium]MCB9102135.1 hypothetical protein [Anaerolineales bacterium]
MGIVEKCGKCEETVSRKKKGNSYLAASSQTSELSTFSSKPFTGEIT